MAKKEKPKVKVVTVFRFDYVVGKDQNEKNWTAYIAGNNKEECIDYLVKFLGGPFKINSLSQECRLDAITDKLREQIIKSVEPKVRPVGRPPGSKTKKEEEDENSTFEEEEKQKARTLTKK